MPPPAAAESPAPAPAPAPSADEIEIPYDHSKQVLVLDMKGLVGLPTDFETDGVTSVRGLLFAKGKVVHVPDMAGNYLTFEAFKAIQMPLYVHFAADTHRPKELATGIVDLSMAGDEREGILIESFRLPLDAKSEKNSPVLQLLDERIAGFSVVPPADHKLLANLKVLPTAIVQNFGLTKINDSLRLTSPKLEARVELLCGVSMTAIDAKGGEIGAQNQRAGQLFKTQNAAKLAALRGTLSKMDLTGYDKTMKARVRVMSATPGSDELNPDWLVSPIRARLRESKAELVKTTLRRSFRLGAVEEEQAGEGDEGAGGADAGQQGEGQAGGTSNAEQMRTRADEIDRAMRIVAELSSDSEEDKSSDTDRAMRAEQAMAEEARPARTTRGGGKPVARLIMGGTASGKQKQAAAKPAAKCSAKRGSKRERPPNPLPDPADLPPGVKPEDAPLGWNWRQDKPYTKGQYSSRAAVSTAVKASAAKESAGSTELVADLRKEIKSLQEQKGTLEQDKARLTQQLAVSEAQKDAAVEKVRAEYEAKISTARTEGLQAGMNAAQQMFQLMRGGGGSPAQGSPAFGINLGPL